MPSMRQGDEVCHANIVSNRQADSRPMLRCKSLHVFSSGYGPTKPVAPHDTPEGRMKNRRVEVVSLGCAQ